MKTPHINDLMNFLNSSPTSYQAAEQIEKQLLSKGFVKLEENDFWKLTPGKKYYVVRNQSAVMAFIPGKKKMHTTGFRIAASHLDSPGLKIKPDGVRTERNNTKLTVEMYGGPIVNTWLDRELSIAGRIMVKNPVTKKNAARTWQSKLININQPVAIIPNAAIHLNRDVNKGFEYNAQNHLPAIIQAFDKQNKAKTLKEIISQYTKTDAKNIGEFDLFLYDPSPAVRIGADHEMLVSGRLDNLAMTHAILSSLTEIKFNDYTQIAAFYDHEEIGSTTPQGAHSSFTKDILQRICFSEKLSQEETMIAYRKSFLISADMAHAVHPNFAEKHDPAYMPLMNHGPVIKINSSQRYTTSSETCSIFESICKNAGVPVQKIINRSDMGSGSTIGPITSAMLSIPAVDIGNPLWAMHSIRETMGVFDHEYLIQALTSFYNFGI